MPDKIRVSIICNAYNHEKYIEDTLKGFVSQQTDFSYEVLIHDDASTDGTADIIRKYEKMYPDIIKPIYQSENQYSQKVKITSSIQLPRAQGDYIAICEGDDYWIDENKLQKQFDMLEEYDYLNMCVHAAYVEIDGARRKISRPAKRVRIFSTEEVIVGDGDFFATASIFARKKLFDSELYKRSPYQYDYMCQMLGALGKGVMFLPDIMSVYRFRVKDSWTTKVAKSSHALAQNCERISVMLDYFDRITDGKFTHVIQFQKASYLFIKGYTLSDKKMIKESQKVLCSKDYMDCYNYLIPSVRIRKYIKHHFYWLLELKKLLSRRP
ncbi:MAG: glycosyltransferase family 2 protein [Lachnospiraceae bacterium]|nr:glycosyltransferase family 2 protein [Lachnospiraceae bacterium]